MASGDTLWIVGDGCAAGERDGGAVLAGACVDGAWDADDVVSLDVIGVAEADGMADVDGMAEVVAGVVPVGPVALPWVFDAQPASPSATATKPIPMWTRLVVMTPLASR